MTAPTADQVAAAMLLPDHPALPQLSRSERALITRVMADTVERRWWPERTSYGHTYPACSPDVDAADDLTLGELPAQMADAGLIALDAGRTPAIDIVTGARYERAQWRVTDAGAKAYRAGGRP